MNAEAGNTYHKSIAPPLGLAWTIWGWGAAFYLVGFFLRVTPAVMTAELMQAFDISAAALGNLSAFYYYSYVAMQIPTGILSDVWGPRRLLTAGAFVAGTGTLMFALAPGIWWAYLGRFLIGGSVAVAFVGTLKLAGEWFPARYFSTVSGVALFFGIIGAVSAGSPLRLSVIAFGWRNTMLFSAVGTFVICAGVWMMVRDHPSQKGYAGFIDAAPRAKDKSQGWMISGLYEVLRYPNTWLLFTIPGGIVGCVLTFGGLWGVPYLSAHHGLSTTRAAALNSAMLVAWAVGGPVFGALSDRIGRRKPLYFVGCGLSVIGWAVILFWSDLPVPLLVFALLAAGFTSGCMIVSFAFAKESVPGHLAGTVNGVVNMGIMLGPTLLQPAVGWMLDRNWNGELVDGMRVYSIAAYHAGFMLMIVWAALSFVLLFFTRETYCRQRK
ncbi:MAG: MFS transporter [Desulfobacterales bacterium]